jgi:hypothetical protein
MGDAKKRGTYDQRKAEPLGRVVTPAMPDSTVLAPIERRFVRDDADNPSRITKIATKRPKAGGYLSRDGRSAYYFDGKTLRRVTSIQPTQEL